MQETGRGDTVGDRYKWVALSNTTLGVLLATLDVSITLIAMPDIFRGIHLDPLIPSNSFYLLWMILGYMIVGSVLIVSLGRLGRHVRPRPNLQPRVHHLHGCVAAARRRLDDGARRSDYLIGFRLVQGVGGACLMANAAAIITDAFPENQRGMALGINNIVGVSGMFIGLVLGGLLAPVSWRLVFLISVPVGLFGTVWAYRKLRELRRAQASSRRLVGERHLRGWSRLPDGRDHLRDTARGRHPTGWSTARVLLLLSAGGALLLVFAAVERRVPQPMFRLQLFKLRAFTFGTLSTFLAAVARGGLMFMLIIWLQGIWLPQHGYDFSNTPLWAGIYMLPLIAGFLVAGPISGYLSDRYGARPFASGGMVAAQRSASRCSSPSRPTSPTPVRLLLFLNGIAMGLFASPNRAAVMNSLPRGVAA